MLWFKSTVKYLFKVIDKSTRLKSAALSVLKVSNKNTRMKSFDFDQLSLFLTLSKYSTTLRTLMCGVFLNLEQVFPDNFKILLYAGALQCFKDYRYVRST